MTGLNPTWSPLSLPPPTRPLRPLQPLPAPLRPPWSLQPLAPTRPIQPPETIDHVPRDHNLYYGDSVAPRPLPFQTGSDATHTTQLPTASSFNTGLVDTTDSTSVLRQRPLRTSNHQSEVNRKEKPEKSITNQPALANELQHPARPDRVLLPRPNCDESIAVLLGGAFDPLASKNGGFHDAYDSAEENAFQRLKLPPSATSASSSLSPYTTTTTTGVAGPKLPAIPSLGTTFSSIVTQTEFLGGLDDRGYEFYSRQRNLRQHDLRHTLRQKDLRRLEKRAAKKKSAADAAAAVAATMEASPALYDMFTANTLVKQQQSQQQPERIQSGERDNQTRKPKRSGRKKRSTPPSNKTDLNQTAVTEDNQTQSHENNQPESKENNQPESKENNQVLRDEEQRDVFEGFDRYPSPVNLNRSNQSNPFQLFSVSANQDGQNHDATAAASLSASPGAARPTTAGTARPTTASSSSPTRSRQSTPSQSQRPPHQTAQLQQQQPPQTLQQDAPSSRARRPYSSSKNSSLSFHPTSSPRHDPGAFPHSHSAASFSAAPLTQRRRSPKPASPSAAASNLRHRGADRGPLTPFGRSRCCCGVETALKHPWLCGIGVALIWTSVVVAFVLLLRDGEWLQWKPDANRFQVMGKGTFARDNGNMTKRNGR